MSFQTSTLPPHRALFTAFALIGLCTWSACQHQQAENAAAAAPLEKTEVYGTGQVSRRYQEINGKKEGKMTDYYPDGKLKAERWFKADRQNASLYDRLNQGVAKTKQTVEAIARRMFRSTFRHQLRRGLLREQPRQ